MKIRRLNLNRLPREVTRFIDEIQEQLKEKNKPYLNYKLVRTTEEYEK